MGKVWVYLNFIYKGLSFIRLGFHACVVVVVCLSVVFSTAHISLSLAFLLNSKTCKVTLLWFLRNQ